MPIYLYRCEACDAQTEALQKVGAAPPAECPACGAAALKKILAQVGIVFKGTGFHKNDYSASSKSKPSGATKSSAEGGGEKTDTTSSDKKEAAARSEERRVGKEC